MRDRSAGRSARGSRLPLVLVALALAGAAAIAGVAATREATAQGWFPDGLWRLALDVFWRRFDPVAGAGLAVVVAALVVPRLLRRWRPAAGYPPPAPLLAGTAIAGRLS